MLSVAKLAVGSIVNKLRAALVKRICALSILSTLNLKLMTNRSQSEGYSDSPEAPATTSRSTLVRQRERSLSGWSLFPMH